MRKLIIPLLASSAALAGCAVEPAPVRPATAAEAAAVCGSYGYVDVNNDGVISGDEWNTYRTSTYSFWDTDRDGKIDRDEFERCWRAGGFYRSAYYNPDYWSHYWTAFDANGDGFLSADEYWSSSAWSRIDRNANGRIDANEWVWWPM
ncbi:MAG: EF-hand domain-containing protein [Sphingomicrobium sp.]